MSENNLNKYDGGAGGNGGNAGPPSGNGNGGNGNGGKDPRKQNIVMFLIAALISLLLISSFVKLITGGSEQEISYNEFISMLEEQKVETVVIGGDRVYIQPKTEKGTSNPLLYLYGVNPSVSYYTGKIEEDDTLTARLLKYDVEVRGQVADGTSALISFLLSYVFPFLLMWVFLVFLFRKMSKGGGPMGVGKSNAKVYVQRETGITFKDVAGEDEAKESLQEVVDFLHNPGKYGKIGAKLPKGALLVGPPGTGKTLLAKAVAGEAKVPFFSLSGSDFIELYVGVGASRVRDLFKEATKNAPCIIFIDEIDAIGRSRDSKYGGGNEEREQTLNQLLSEMDGFDTSKGILVLGATNRPEILDKALLRPGRFDRRIIVDKPDLKGRVEILKVHAKDVHLADNVDLDAIALATSGAVGADLANMINEAAINAVQHGREYVTQKDLFDAVEQVLVGKEKKDRIMSAEERKIVSYHEVGHALISALQKNSEPVQKITIVPRTMGALGYVMHVPEEEKYLQTEAELHDRLVSLLGGRAAEEIVFGNVTTGAANDIEQATNMATNMITRFGMSKRFGLMGLATVESEYLGGGARLTCSDRTAADVDTEVMETLKQCYEEAKELLSANREIMDKLAAHLIEKETISGKEFMKIYRAEKGIPEPEEKSGEETVKSAKDDFFAKKDDSFFADSVLGSKDAPGEQRPEGNSESSLREQKPEGNSDSSLREQRPEGNSESSLREQRTEGDSESSLREQRPEGNQEPSLNGENGRTTGSQPREEEKRDGGNTEGTSRTTGRFSNSSLDIK